MKDIYDNLVDKDGYVDVETLKKTMREADERAKMAIETAKKAEEEAKAALLEAERIKQQGIREKRDYEENEIMREVHAKYPKLDPESETFDQNFYDAVRGELISQLQAGTIEDVRSAAEKWHGILYPVTKKEEKQKEEQKRQINAMGSGVKQQDPYQNAEFEQLRHDSMYGKKGALAERLKRSGH